MSNYCNCGCGILLKWEGQRFVRGHNMRVQNFCKDKTYETLYGVKRADWKNCCLRKIQEGGVG